MLGSYGTSASWAGVVYENRYVLEDGVWKIRELSYNSQYSARYSPPALTVPKWNLPNHYTAESAGAPVQSSRLPAEPPASLEQLQQRWASLTRAAQQLQDETEVLNLQNNYGYYSDQKMWSAAANLFATDGSLELAQRGVYVGKERIRRALSVFSGDALSPDEVNDHLQLATVVHVAPDGRTAKLRGVELSVAGVKGKGAQWEEGIFENEYAKQNGVWRIHRVHYYPRVLTDYELGWAKDAKPAAGPSASFPPDRPPTEVYEAYPKMYYPRLHYANPVTHAAVQYPSGVTAAASKSDSSSVAALPTAPKNAKEFTARLNELETEIHSSIAYDAVENLASAHGYSLEDASLDVHQLVQPVITLASDKQSATIRARLLKVDGKAGGFSGASFEARAVTRDGVWRLESPALKQAWSSSFNKWMPVIEPRR
jgi:hypothetical protein